IALAVTSTQAWGQERTIVTEAPSTQEYIDYLFQQEPPTEIKTRGIRVRGIQMTGSTAASAPMTPKVSAPAARPAPAAASGPAPTQVSAPAPTPRPTPAPAPKAAPSATVTQAALPQPSAAPAAAQPTKTAAAQAPAQPKIVAAPVSFEHDSAEIPLYFEPYLINLAAAMQRPEAKGKLLVVSGHTDSRGSASYNLALSMRRAQAIEAFLLARGVPSNQLVSTGKGERELIAGREDEHAINRRVEFTVAN
ncbi:MAG: OmpA family protein, partial [Pseudomonadota bacterium]